MNLYSRKCVIVLTVLAVTPTLYSSQASSHSASSSASASTKSNEEAEKLNHLGYMCENGNGVTKDIKQAIDYYEQAAKLGNADALYHLGDIFYNDVNVPKDLKRAHDYYLQAAQQGHPWAQHNLGVMYLNGIGRRKNPTKALQWYLASASNHHAWNSTRAIVYPFLQSGIFIRKDVQKAADFFKNIKDTLGGSSTNSAEREYRARNYIVQTAHRGELPEPKFPVAFLDVCTICGDSIEFNDEVVILPCNHCFCKECINPWVTAHHTCPSCHKSDINPNQFHIGIAIGLK